MTQKATKRRDRRVFTFAWIAALTILTTFLIYREMTAVLYILATLGVTAILVVVALADLAHAERFSSESPRPNDAAAIGSGLSASNRTSQR